MGARGRVDDPAARRRSERAGRSHCVSVPRSRRPPRALARPRATPRRPSACLSTVSRWPLTRKRRGRGTGEGVVVDPRLHQLIRQQGGSATGRSRSRSWTPASRPTHSRSARPTRDNVRADPRWRRKRWDWHLVAPELRKRGHEPVAVDLPCEQESAGWWAYAAAVVDALAERRDVIVVGHSLGGFTAPLVCARIPADLLILLAG